MKASEMKGTKPKMPMEHNVKSTSTDTLSAACRTTEGAAEAPAITYFFPVSEK